MHPRKDSILAEVEIINGAMGTTAATFKHIEFEGRRLGHVLNPKTAWPVTECETVSVLASDATEADALSTAIFVGGTSLAERLTAARNDLGILYLPAQGPARLFGSLAERFHFR
jgi:thiamine biosynthesis lipoprotein